MVTEKNMYILAVLGLVGLAWWLAKSNSSQYALINSLASPYNTGDPAKTDKKLGIPTLKNTKKGGAAVNKVPVGLTSDERRLQDAKLSNEAKFPVRDFTPTSQHEVYTRDKGIVAINAEMDLHKEQIIPTGIGDRSTIIVPGEKQLGY